MTLNAIDQALNVALTGLIYGSGAWFACAFGLYVVGRNKRGKRKALLPIAVKSLPKKRPVEVPAAEVSEVTAALTHDARMDEAAGELNPKPGIEIIIEQPVAEEFTEKEVAAHESVAKKKWQAVTGSEIGTKCEAEQITDSPARERLSLPRLKVSGQPVLTPPKTAQSESPLLEIVCEPVDWKKWRVADLRRANIAKICGVRTKPIGSKRNLRKVDLIAQYEQQLKRLTKAAPEVLQKQEDVA